MTTSTNELKLRVEQRKHQMLARIAELEADTAHEAGVVRAKVMLALDELEEVLKDGWDKVSDKVTARLNAWLDRA